MSLLSIPLDIIKEIVGGWLLVYEWALLDSSLMNKDARSKLLECLESIQFQSNAIVPRSMEITSSYYQWIRTRRIKLDIIRVSGDVDDNLWLIDFSAVKCLSISKNDGDVVLMLMNRCPRLSELELSGVWPGKFIQNVNVENIDVSVVKNIVSISIYSTALQFSLLNALACQATSLMYFRNFNSSWFDGFETTLLVNNQNTLRTYSSTSQLLNPGLVYSLVTSCLSLNSVSLRCDAFPVEFVSAFFNRRATVTDLSIEGDEFEFLYKNSSLRKLLEIKNLSSAELAAVVASLPPGLNEVYLDVNVITDESFQTLFESSRKELDSLHLILCTLTLSAAVLRNVLSSATNLRLLGLNQCEYTADELQLILCPAVASWRHLELCDCPHLTDSIVMSLVSSAPRLKILSIAACPNVSEQPCGQLNHVSGLELNIY